MVTGKLCFTVPLLLQKDDRVAILHELKLCSEEWHTHLSYGKFQISHSINENKEHTTEQKISLSRNDFAHVIELLWQSFFINLFGPLQAVQMNFHKNTKLVHLRL